MWVYVYVVYGTGVHPSVVKYQANKATIVFFIGVLHL